MRHLYIILFYINILKIIIFKKALKYFLIIIKRNNNKQKYYVIVKYYLQDYHLKRYYGNHSFDFSI